MLSRAVRRWLIAAAIVAVVVGAYAIFGFLGVPRLLRSNLQSFVGTHYSRQVSIGDIRFNPFTLTLDVRAVSLPDTDGQPMLSFGRLFVNLGIVSIWRRGPSFQEIALEDPFAHVLIRKDGSLNLADLGKGFAPEQAPPKGKPAQPLRLFISKLSIRRGRTVYEDRSRPDTFVADLTPITFDLRDFSTAAATDNAYSLEGATEAGERFNWSGTLGMNPVSSRGRFEVDHLLARTLWAYARDSLGFEIASGTIGLTGDYAFTSAGNPIGLDVDVHELTVADLGLRPRGKDSNYVDLQHVEVQGTHVDLAKHAVAIAKVHLSGGGVKAWRDANGSINLMELAKAPAPGSAAVPSSASATAPAPPAAQPGWTISAPDIAIDGFRISAEDRQTMPVFAMTLDPLDIHLTGFTTAAGAALQIEADTAIDGSARLTAKARVSPETGAAAAHVELAGLDLKAFQPYLARQTSLTLLSGLLGTTLDIERGRDGVLGVTGDTNVTRLRTVDNALRKDFVKWDDVRVVGIDYRSQPARLRIKSVNTKGLYARVIIAANQVTNIAEVLTPPNKTPGTPPRAKKADESAPAAATATQVSSKKAGKGRKTAPPEELPPSGPTMAVSIGEIRVVNGSAHFADYSIQPNYAVAIQSLNGAVTGLSSDPKAHAKVKLEGKVDRYAPVNIEGTINPFSAAAYSDIRMSFKGVEMSSVTPYSGRFAGYKIDKGKLSADLTYHIEQRKLQADHHIVIDQLQLGDKVDSPEATKLPLKLAVALLKDRNGVIDLGLPVTGSLDDPQFKLGPLIWKVVVNLITKAATAPFALLGRLFGGGDQMNVIDFKPGSATLEPGDRDKMASVAKAMKERPQLELDVPMAFSAPLDTPILARRALQEKLIAQQRKNASASTRKRSADTPPADPATVLSDPAEHFRLLAEEFRAELGKDAPLPDSAVAVEAAKKKKGETPAFDPAIADLENALAARVQVTDSDLQDLGKRRAHSIQDALLGGGDIDPARVFLINAAPKSDTQDAVRLELALK